MRTQGSCLRKKTTHTERRGEGEENGEKGGRETTRKEHKGDTQTEEEEEKKGEERGKASASCRRGVSCRSSVYSILC